MILHTFDERNGVSGHALFATDETHTLAGGGFERNGIKIDMEQRGKDGFHRVDVGIDFGALGTNRAIDVAYAVAVRFEQIDRAAEEHFAVSAFIFGGGVGKVIADVAEIGCTEEGVADGVNEHIGVAVAEESEGVVDVYTADPQLAAGGEGVNIISETDSHDGGG